jgi:hypothetical protein
MNGKRYQWKTYKAKRQLKLYNQATQHDFKITESIVNQILNESSTISGFDRIKLEENLIQ